MRAPPRQALFFDRLDSASADSLGNEPPRLIPFAHLVVQMRNRAYMPQLGRFLQPDPNATALTLIEATSYHGRGMGALVAAFDVQGLYGDGMNLYEYAGSNPWMRADPLGLSWDPFSMVDEYLAEDAGSKAAFLERVIGGAKTAAYVGLMIMSTLPFPVTALAADIGASALEGEMSPELQMARKILGYASLAAVGATISRLAYSAGRAAVAYFAKHGWRGVGRAAWNLSGFGLAHRAYKWLTRKKAVPGACGCFAAATLVWTPIGPVPIADLEVGDQVVARDEQTGELSLQRVTATIVTDAAAVLDVRVRHTDGRLETVRTTDEHPFWVNGTGWVRADALTPGMGVSTLSGGAWQGLEGGAEREEAGKGAVGAEVASAAVIETVHFTTERRSVHNITVASTSTYHVGPDGVLVHNCGAGGHHLVAQYLSIGSLESSVLYSRRLSSYEHTQLHGFINAAGAEFGIPSKQAGRAAVLMWVDEVGEEFATAAIIQALRKGHAAFDLQHGHTTILELDRVLKKLEYLP